MQTAHQARIQRFFRLEHARRVTPFKRFANANDARQKPRRTRFWNDAATGEYESQLYVGRSNANIHRQRHGDAHAHGWTIDSRDDGLVEIVNTARNLSAAVADVTFFVLGLLRQVFGVLAPGFAAL